VSHSHKTTTMADERVVSDIVTKFLLNTCRLRPRPSRHGLQAAVCCAQVAAHHPPDDAEADRIPLISGSVAEFYIEPMLPLVGDIDVMGHHSDMLAIPRGHPPPTQLPAEFSDNVTVGEIVDSHLPGYVYLELRYFLTKCSDDYTYNYFETEHGLYLGNTFDQVERDAIIETARCHRPAVLADYSNTPLLSVDTVHCERCLSWPPQAADWPTRHRNYDWPDSATVNHVINNGCDVVGAVHRQCRQDEWMSKYQWRLSFSRAEIVLLNSWMPLQQIVYHMLRFFFKTKRLTGSDASEALSNYHIKTLMMWACELKSSSFWTDDLNLVRVCVELLHILSVWLSDARCNHYFISSCNLIDNIFGVELRPTAMQLMSIDESWLSTWFINNYIQKCSMVCPENVSSLFSDISTNTKLQRAVSAVVDWRISQNTALVDMWCELHFAELVIPCEVSVYSLTAQSCVSWLRELAKTYTCLPLYFTAITFLEVTYRISRNGFTDKLMDVLLTILGQLVSTCRHASQCSSELSLSKATELMKIVASSSHGTIRLIATELSSANDLNTSELVKLLQRSAIEHLTTYRQLRSQDFGSVATIVTTDFEALYTYKYGSYQQCLQLSTQNVHTLLYAVKMPLVPMFPVFMQFLNYDIVSLTALTLIVNPECRNSGNNVVITQLTLSLYLMTQCQLKLRHSVTSLAQTLIYIKVAQRRHPAELTLNHLTLKLTERKVLMYIQQSLM